MLTKRVCGIFLKVQNDSQITDLLQLSRKENESRIFCLNVLRRRQAWKKMQESHKDISTVYAKMEGVLLVKQVRNAIFFYKVVRDNRIKAFSLYVDKLSPRNALLGGAR